MGGFNVIIYLSHLGFKCVLQKLSLLPCYWVGPCKLSPSRNSSVVFGYKGSATFIKGVSFTFQSLGIFFGTKCRTPNFQGIW